MIFKPTDCDVGFTYSGVNYEFEADQVVIEDPETKGLVRGANSKNITGLVFTEGMKTPKTVTATVMNVPGSLFAILESIYANDERIDFYIVDRKTGSSRICKESLLTQVPRQLTVGEGADAFNVEVKLNTFQISDKHKDA